MHLISDQYRALLQQAHTEEGWGTSGHRWALTIRDFVRHRTPRAASVLDYGAGKGTLAAALRTELPGVAVYEYDPAIPGKESARAVDVLVSTDVLEHVEPECVDAVLSHMREHTLHAAFLVIALFPPNEWIERIKAAGWTVTGSSIRNYRELVVICKP